MIKQNQMEPDDIFMRIREKANELKRHKKADLATEMTSRILRCGNYEEAFKILNQYSLKIENQNQ